MALLYRDGFVDTDDGLSVYYRAYGLRNPNKKPIICLPGLTRNSKDFHAFAQRRAQNFDDFLIAIDMRGRGRSSYDPKPINYRVEVEALDIIKVLQTEKIETADFVGTSRGGIQAAVIAAVRPEYVSSVILNDIGAKMPYRTLERIQAVFRVAAAARFSEREDLLKALHKYDAYVAQNFSPEEERDFINASYVYRNGVYQADFDIEGLAAGYEAGLNALRAVNSDSETADLSALFAALKEKPVLLLQGENSDLCTDAEVRATAALISRFTHVQVPGRGHVPLLTEDVCVKAVDAFLERVAS